MAAPVIDSTNVLLDAVVGPTGTTGQTDVAADAFGGASIITSYDADPAAGAGYGWLPTDVGVRSNGGATADNQLQGFIEGSANEFGPVDGSSAVGAGKRLFYSHIYSSQGSALNNWNNVGTTGYGGIFWLFSNRDPDLTAATDRTANCRGWCVGGRDTIPTLFAPTPTSFLAVDAEHTASEVQTGAGTELTHILTAATPGRFDPTSIVCAGWGWKLTGGGFIGTVSRLGYYDAYTAYEGDAGNPGRFQLFYDQTQSEQHYGVAKGDSAQFRFRLAIEFGHRSLGDTAPTLFEDENVSVEFSESMQALQTPLVRVLHAPFNKIGMEEKLRAGDVWRCTNVQFTGATPWHLRFASTLGATVEFNNCIIQNAGGTADDVAIGADVLINGGLIDACGKMSVGGGTIQNAGVTNPASTACLAIDPTSTLDALVFETTDPITYAIEMRDPAGGTDNYTLTDLTYAGFDFDIRVLGATGTVNITVQGGDTPSVSSGTITDDVIALLGVGWADGTPYTAEAGANRIVAVVVSNNDSKLPDGVTFGGATMTLLASQLQEQIGLSLWYIDETANPGVFTGSQAIAATWTGGTPTVVDFQRATYSNVRPVINQGTPATATQGNTAAGAGGDVTVLNALATTDETATLVYPISAGTGTNRLLYVGCSHEDNGGAAGGFTASYGGQAMTLIGEAYSTPGSPNNGASAFYLDEAGIQAAVGSTITVSGFTGDTPSIFALALDNVDQTTPLRDSGTATANAVIGSLAINDGDMIVSVGGSTDGNAGSITFLGDLATPDASFQFNTASVDTHYGAHKLFPGPDTLTGEAYMGGGSAPRCGVVTGIFAVGGSLAGDLSVTLPNVGDNNLVLAAAQTNSATPFGIALGGDVTERDQVDKTNQRAAVGDLVFNTGPGPVTASFPDSSATTGDDAQLLAAALRPTFTSSGGPTVNLILQPATLTVRCLDNSTKLPVQNVRVRVEATNNGPLPNGTAVIDGVLTDVNGEVTDTRSYGAPQDLTGVAREDVDGSPHYQQGDIVTTINQDDVTVTVLLVPDE